MTANAIEVSGVGSVGLAVDQVSSGSLGSSTTPSSGSTPALTTSEALLVAALGCNTSKGSITAQVVSPVWTQEIEELSNAHAVGETDSRIVSSALGTTPSGQWTLNTADSWVAAIVAFKVGVAAPIGITLISDRQYTAPAAADSISITPSGVAWTNSAYVTVLDPTPAACVLTGITTYTGDGASNSINYDAEIDIATGAAGVEVVIATVRVANNLIFQSGVTGPTHWSGMPIPIDAIGSGVRVSARLRKNNTNLTPWTVAITYLQKPLTSLIQTTIAAPKTLPPAAAGVAVTASSTLWANGSWAQLRAASGASLVITGVALRTGSGGTFELDLGIGGAGAETVITTLRLETTNQGQPGTILLSTPLNAVPSSARLSARLRGSVASGSLTLSLMVLENPL
jgi:hypothetical protein